MTLFLRLLVSGTSKIHLLFNRLAGFIDEQLYSVYRYWVGIDGDGSTDSNAYAMGSSLDAMRLKSFFGSRMGIGVVGLLSFRHAIALGCRGLISPC
jgi:hypothetical protein